VKVEQMMAHVLAEMRTNREKMDTKQVEMRASQQHLEEEKASQELLKSEMLSKMETNQEKLDMKVDANQEKMEARIDANNEKFEVL
jgi:hypothetical protein